MKKYDLFVIGGGSGGVRGARIASTHGAKVGISEFSKWGGTCVNLGCVPKKLYHNASFFSKEIKNAKNYGWSFSNIDFNWHELKKNVFNQISNLNKKYETILSENNIDLYKNFAKIIDHNKILLDNEVIEADKILISTGSEVITPDIPGKEYSVTSDEIFFLENFPKKIAIIGGGYIALEFASIFSGLGSEVSLFIRGKDLLGRFDEDIRSIVKNAMIKDGIKVFCSYDIKSLSKNNDKIIAKFENHNSEEELFSFDQVMFATGRKPRIKNLFSDNVKLEIDDRGAIKIDEYSKTSIENIFAVGDVTNKVNLTPVAIAAAHAFADTEFGSIRRKISYDHIPTAIFSTPEIATVGLTESEARKNPGVKVKKAEFTPLKYSLFAEEERILHKFYIKIVTDFADKILGIHLVGENSAEMIQGFAVLIKMGANIKDIKSVIPIHPTTAEEIILMK